MKRISKRLEAGSRVLFDLRDMARLEASIGDDSEIAIKKVWRAVADWADGTAARHKINLDDFAAIQREREGAHRRKAVPDVGGAVGLETSRPDDSRL